MRIPVRVWSTFLVLFFAAWCGGGRAAINQSVTETTMAQAIPERISLDFTPMTDPTSTFIVIKPDNQAKVVRYSRSLLVVNSLAEGLLPRPEMSNLLDKTRAPAFANAACNENFGTPGLTRGDQFHLTINIEQKQKECRGFVEDAPAAIRTLVEELLSTNQKLNPVTLGAAYVRSEPISPTRFEALRKSTRVKFLTPEEFPADIQQILSLAINNPRDFLVLSREQQKNLQDRVTNGQEFFITHKNSGHQFTIFLAKQ